MQLYSTSVRTQKTMLGLEVLLQFTEFLICKSDENTSLTQEKGLKQKFLSSKIGLKKVIKDESLK
jgi:hypothetical protein